MKWEYEGLGRKANLEELKGGCFGKQSWGKTLNMFVLGLKKKKKSKERVWENK